MSKIKLRGKKVAVEKLKKPSKKTNDFLVMMESEEYLGTIRHVGTSADPELKVGQRVYFTTNFQTVRMDGTELCVMDDESVVAVVVDEEPKEESTQS